MKKNIKYTKWIIFLLTILAITFVSCKDDEGDSGKVVLDVFGPSPSPRGGTLTFIGENMDKVSSVIFPNDIEISEIEIESSEKIKVVIPQDAVPGYVKLKTQEGDIQTQTILSYSEPISISKISSTKIKAGQMLTLEGDYLNLVSKIVFADDVNVICTDFSTWERKKITLTVPMEAQTGRLILSDTTSNPVELLTDSVIQIVLPSVSSVVTLENKKPEDVITVSGSDLDLVASVLLPNDSTVDFTVANNTLSFILPAGCTDGEINMLAYSGIAIAIANVTMAIPTEMSATPSVGLRTSDEISIVGTNMDLVTSIVFPGTSDAVVPNSISATEIKLTMAAAAISGDIIINTASGNTTTVTIETQKPEVTSFNPSPVSAGDNVTLTGTDLDLVEVVTFTGDIAGEIISTSATEVVVGVPVDAVSGELILTMANGETVTTSSLDVEKPAFCYIPVLPADSVEINAGEILSLEIQNADVLTDVQINGSTTQYILQGSLLYVLIPNNAGGVTDLKLISSNGEVVYQIEVIGAGTVETVIMDVIHDLGNWTGEGDGGAFRIYKESFTDVPAGSIMKFYFTVTGDGQVQLNDANWAAQETLTLTNETFYEMELTQEFLDHILSESDGWSETALVIQGQQVIISKVSIIVSGAAAETVILEETHDLGSWTGEGDGGAFRLYKEAFAGVSAGSTLKFYLSVYGTGQMQINDANWAQQVMFESDDTSVAYYEYEMTQDFLDHIQSESDGWSETALVVQGQSIIVTKVSIVN